VFVEGGIRDGGWRCIGATISPVHRRGPIGTPATTEYGSKRETKPVHAPRAYGCWLCGCMRRHGGQPRAIRRGCTPVRIGARHQVRYPLHGTVQGPLCDTVQGPLCDTVQGPLCDTVQGPLCVLPQSCATTEPPQGCATTELPQSCVATELCYHRATERTALPQRGPCTVSRSGYRALC
jgi:hypothetical protein